MLEFYQAYATYEDLMSLTETLVSRLAREVTGALVAPFEGALVDYTPPWQRLSMVGEVGKRLAHDAQGLSRQLDALARLPDEGWLKNASDAEVRHKFAKAHSLGAKIAWPFEPFVEPMLPRERPCFVIDFLLEVSPLARTLVSVPTLLVPF